MEHTPVSSTTFSSVGYDAESQILEIEFNHDGVYQYAGVPEWEYEGLMNSGSKGQYFNSNIKDKYPCGKL